MFPDTEKAKVAMSKTKRRKGKANKIAYPEFINFFVKGVFRSSLQNVMDQLDEQKFKNLS